MAETWSSAPFISYDGPDENKVRAEVSVVLGFGRVESIEDSNNGKSKNIHFVVENTKYKPSGWTPDPKLLKKLEEAQENNTPIHFRIETRRKANIDRSEPIDELRTLAKAKDSIYKSLAAVKFDEDEQWTISAHAVTRLDEDPQGGNGVNSAYNYSLEELQAMRGGAAGTVAAGVDEARVTLDEDGKIRPGSLAVAAPVEILSFVSRYAHDNGIADLVDGKKKMVLCKSILAATNKAQIQVCHLNTPDLGASSHERAREIVFEVIESNKLLSANLSSKEAIQEWVTNLSEKTIKIWEWSIQEVARSQKIELPKESE